jgi:predicted nucleic acid-binding protein
VKALLDTCALSELRKSSPNPAVVAAVQAIPDAQLYVSVLSLGEIAKGVGLLAGGKKRDTLTAWLAALENQFSDRLLGLDVETAKLWGELTARAQKKGVVICATDGLLAATALRHGLHVMTRNESDFKASGVRIINPWRGTS